MKYLFLFTLASVHLALEAKQKIVSLAPHTTELVFALEKGQNLVAVSDFSNFPQAATKLPSVASHNGVNFEQIIRLQPDLILAWEGGNKPQDLARLKSMGFELFYSSPKTLNDIAREIKLLGNLLDVEETADKLSNDFLQRLARIKNQYEGKKSIPVFYYMWPKPLMTIGEGAWANQLLAVCGFENAFHDSMADYPQVTVEQVLNKQPLLLLAVMKVSPDEAEVFWQPWRHLLSAPVRTVNPDLLHRFTPRVLDGLEQLCAKRI